MLACKSQILILLVLLTWHSSYSWNSRLIKKSIIPTVILVPLFYNIPIIPVISKIPLVHAIEYNDIDQASKSALTNVYNVFLNLKYIENDIENGESPQTIIKEVRTLLTNYRLKDSLQKSLVLANNKNEAESIGRNIIENLNLIYEYYEDNIDNMTGVKTPPKEVLLFAKSSLSATTIEFNKLFNLYPLNVIEKLKETL